MSAADAMPPSAARTLLSALQALRKEVSGGGSTTWINKVVSAVALLQVFAESSTRLIVASERSFHAVLGQYRASAGCLQAMGFVEVKRRGKTLYVAGTTRECLRLRAKMSMLKEILAIFAASSTRGFRADEVATMVADLEAAHQRKGNPLSNPLSKFRKAGQAVVAQNRFRIHAARRRKKRLTLEGSTPNPASEVPRVSETGTVITTVPTRKRGATMASKMAALQAKKEGRKAVQQDDADVILAGGTASRFALIASAKKEKRIIAEGGVLPSCFTAQPTHRAGAKPDGLRLVLQAMRTHPGNEKVEAAACACVYSYLTSTAPDAQAIKDIRRTCLDEYKLLPKIIDLVLQPERTPIAMETACAALWALCHADTVAAEYAANAGTASALKQVLRAFADEPGVVNAAEQALSCLIVLTRPRRA